jgi:GNAT superfamily N-acetyltransferase
MVVRRATKALEELLADDTWAVFVADELGRVVGLVAVGVGDDPATETMLARRYGLVDPLVVAAGSRKSGIGRELMREAESWAKAKGVSELEAEVWEFDDGPRPFYERIGYRLLKGIFVKQLR